MKRFLLILLAWALISWLFLGLAISHSATLSGKYWKNTASKSVIDQPLVANVSIRSGIACTAPAVADSGGTFRFLQLDLLTFNGSPGVGAIVQGWPLYYRDNSGPMLGECQFPSGRFSLIGLITDVLAALALLLIAAAVQAIIHDYFLSLSKGRNHGEL